jgi:hypothetical protein
VAAVCALLRATRQRHHGSSQREERVEVWSVSLRFEV